MKYCNDWITRQCNKILPWWANIQLCFTAFTLKPVVLFNSEIAKMEFFIFLNWGDLTRFSRKSTFFEEIRADLKKNFKFKEIWGNLKRRGKPAWNFQENSSFFIYLSKREVQKKLCIVESDFKKLRLIQRQVEVALT